MMAPLPRAQEGRSDNNPSGSYSNHHKVNRLISHSRMSRIHFLMLVGLFLVEQHELTVFAWASSAIAGPWPSKQNVTWTQLRGGQDVENEDIEDVDSEDERNDGETEEKKVEKSIEMYSKEVANQNLKLRSAFRLLQEMREEVVSLANVITDSNENVHIQNELVDEHFVEPVLTNRTFVGGALAIQSKQEEKEPGQAKLMASTSIVVDASRVAPLSSRLLEEIDNVKEDTEDGLETESSTRGNDFLRLWWPNVWTQQLAELQSVSEIMDENENEEASERDAAEEMEVIDHNEGSDKTVSSIISEGEVDDMVTDSESEEKGIKTEIMPINPAVKEKHLIDSNNDLTRQPWGDESSFVSSGAWIAIDKVLSLGLASYLPVLRLSSKLRHVRKLSARITGLHGLVSGKPSPTVNTSSSKKISSEDEERLKNIQKRIAAIEKVREGVVEATEVKDKRIRTRFGFIRRGREDRRDALTRQEALAAEERRLNNEAEERRRKDEETRQATSRMERVKEIDRLISEGQARLQDLVCEKDVLQRRLNPLFDYTSETVEVVLDDNTDVANIEMQGTTRTNSSFRIEASRKFKFPPDDLVQEYLDMTFSSRRITKLNHTDLWQDTEFEDDEDESIGDDVLTPSADAFRLYQDEIPSNDNKSKQSVNFRKRGGGSWLLRQTIGKGPSIGEKIGEVAETAAYKAVCAAVMSFLARLLSSLHGVNVLKHSDIRLVLEQAPDLPRVGEGIIPGSSSDYAEEAIKTVMRRNSKKGSRRRSKHFATEDSFVQRDAVTEMLLSHVQISAPLLKLFPLAWQRAFLGNIITLATAIMTDFFEGLQFQILGHSLMFAFAPITQDDMINHIALSGSGFNSRRLRADEFEAAVRATAGDVGENLKFLDRWHERALGSGVLRTQIANLIARIVLTLTDEILTGARMDLWSSQAGGPRMLAGLEYRTTGEEKIPL